ncbi:hypothetical protein Patl1_21305 [Pistacia atlantica]|uniref:Uncharacterized protein n=1 Tax=Pistacia atlantica TaxID=434234 RepID=A0ACC1BHY9_9ROSI|nr:hypothetical protein Patl1_21305 [Pistacia atlantica]
MSKAEKRRHHDHPSPQPTKKLHSAFPSTPPKRPIFTSHLQVPNVPPQIRHLCDIISSTPSTSVEKILDETDLRVSQETVEQVLKLSYAHPGPAVKFFRWSGYQLNDKHSPYAWNLVVDLLGKNSLFDAMWDAIKSMNKEGLLSDVRGGELVWEAMIGLGRIGLRPDTLIYNSMMTLYCYSNDIGAAIKLLDEMVYNGAFPDMQTYNVLFQFLIKCRKLREASGLFNEMVKNECVLNQENCCAAIRIYMDSGDPYIAIKFWKYMMENYHSDLSETGNLFVVGLCDMDMHPEAVKYAEGMIEKGIQLTPSSLLKLKQCLAKARKVLVYEELSRKCQSANLSR